ncbi:MAG: type IX secretion system sortase PorU, partial [Candidatus Hodarchaeota archaeon]
VFVDTVNSNLPKRYLALTPERIRSPERMEKDIISDLRASTRQADFIIITHDDFYDQALPLKSLRENCDNLKTEVVKISDIYDEFSWGLFDPVAIRDFIKYAFDNWVIQPRYVLLFGSGDFDYRNIIDPVDHNWIPPFETTEKYEGNSRAWDDWYVCVNGDDYYIDLAIGRLPVRNPDHARNVIKKIIDYQNTPVLGDWRNNITIIADDVTGESTYGIEREHTEESENITQNFIPKSFNVNKIYLVEYPPVYTASITGIRKPAAQQDIIEAINRGCLIINYIGHGRYDLWAHEVVLMMDQDLQKINNGRRQAFWIAATCYFGRFDNPAYESMTEELILLENNGAIAVFASARLVGSAPNAALNKLLYTKLFPSGYHKVRLGDAVAAAKNARGNYENDQKTILFGDPTLYLANPSYKAKITSVTPDTIKALSRLSISGEIQKDGFLWSDFNGNILLRTFDSKKYRTYVLDDNSVLNYWLPGNTIFRGTATINQGRFNFQFIVPKDITYGGQQGRLSLYFWNEEVDGSGFRDLLPVGGTETDLFDAEGPQITIRFNGDDFHDGEFTNENPVLNIEVTDSISGINIAGDIGHSINLTLDEEKYNLTDLFNYNNNSYISGNIAYTLGPLEEGPHKIIVKAWDNSNNSSEVNTEFKVVFSDKLVLKNVLNYPNPFFNSTEFTFWTNQLCEASIKIYTVSGRLIRKIDHLFANNGFNHVYWDGNDEDGNPIANGVYLFKICAKAQYEGNTISAEAIEKLMIMR